MQIDAGSAALVLAAVSLAGFVQGMTGFGFGLVAMALLPLLLDIESTANLVLLLNTLATGGMLFVYRKHYAWPMGRGLILGCCCGVPLGYYVLVTAPHRLLLQSLGVILIAFAANDLLGRDRGRKLAASLGFPLGLVSGGLGGALNVGGPPAIAYVYAQPWTKEQIVAVLQVAFVSAILVRLLLGGVGGSFSGPLLTLLVWAVGPVLASLCLGARFLQRVPQQQLKTGVFVFLGLMGLKYLLLP